MNILLVVNNAYDQDLKYYFFSDIKEETHRIIKDTNMIYLGEIRENNDTLLLEEIISERKEFVEVYPPIGGLFIDIIYEWGYL